MKTCHDVFPSLWMIIQMVDIDKRLEEAMAKTLQRKHDEALRLCNEVLEEVPDSTDALRERSFVYRHMKDVRAASKDLTRLIELGSEEPGDYFVRGDCYINMGDYEQAIRDLTRVVELGEFHQFHYHTDLACFFRAYAFFAAGRYAEALADCERLREGYTYFVGGTVRTKESLMAEIAARLAGD